MISRNEARSMKKGQTNSHISQEGDHLSVKQCIYLRHLSARLIMCEILHQLTPHDSRAWHRVKREVNLIQIKQKYSSCNSVRAHAQSPSNTLSKIVNPNFCSKKHQIRGQCIMTKLYWTIFFFFSFGVPQLMLPEVPQTYGLLYYPRIGLHNFLHQFRAATSPKQIKLEL
jgi:hypothetical protein